MTFAIIFGLSLFTALALGLLLLMARSSAQGALLEEVARQVRGGGPAPASWRSAVSADRMAKPFTVFRRFFASEPDPEIVRRLMLAGYRKPNHADIFLGSRLGVPAFLGLAVALLVSENTVIFFLLLLSARELKYATGEGDWWSCLAFLPPISGCHTPSTRGERDSG